jgi:biofilm PGA synthesis N-glycosyltransferase PgaC
MILLVILVVLFILYAALIIFYWQTWKDIPVFTPGPEPAFIRLSVIIPARNEEENIEALLLALEGQTYSRELFEVIVIDDHSTDSTAEIVRQFKNVTLLQLKADAINSYKKKAIEAGIAAATGELIVTTDADCIPTPDWLDTIATFKMETGAVFIAAPVAFHCNSSLVQVFQAMDFMILQGITGAAVYRNHLSMCNGANLAYERKVFYEAGGFAGIDHIASGDDMLLMHKIARLYPEKLYYVKSAKATVRTAPMKTWKAFFNQRIRWASKATQYNDPRILPVLILVYLFNLSFLLLLVMGCWQPVYFLYAGALLIMKVIAELPFFISLADFFNKRWAVKFFPLFQPLHILYTLLSGLLGQFGKYEWKGRKIR